MARKILIVDSSTTMRRILRSMIQANINDAEISEAQNVDSAWQQIKNEDIHLILFSWEASGNAWLDFLGKLRQHGGGRIASILLTSDHSRPYVKKALTAGASEYLVIPCPPEELSGTMNRVCNPVALRQSNRYSLPETTALLQQGQKGFPAEVVNISKGGMLCEMAFDENFKWQAPAMITVSFVIDGKTFVAADLYSTIGRLSILEANPDLTPRRVRMAFRFFNVPDGSREVLERVFSLADEQEKYLRTQGS